MVRPSGGKGLAYIALYEAPQPSDQTGLEERLLLVLKGGGGMIYDMELDWLPGWGARPHPWAATWLLGWIRLLFGPKPSYTF